MYSLLIELAEFITLPTFRWILILLSVIVNIIKYLNEPQRFSYKIAFSGLSYKWHLYFIAIISCISFCLMTIGLWQTVPFTTYLPNYWYIYIFILCFILILSLFLGGVFVNIIILDFITALIKSLIISLLLDFCNILFVSSFIIF